MAEIGFQQLLDEQKKSNILLADLKKDPSLGSSIKQNLGEILNDMRLAKQTEKFERAEGITQVDDKVEKSNQVLNTQSGFFTDQLKYFARQDNILERMFENSTLSQTDIFATRKAIMKLLEVTTKSKKELKHIEEASSGMYKDFQGNYRLTASQREEEEKDAAAAEGKRSKTFMEILKSNKTTNDLLGFLKNLTPSAGGIKSAIGKLFGIVGLLGLFKFLTSENAMKFAKAMDEVILPGLKTLYEDFIKPLAVNIANMVGSLATTLSDPDASILEKVLAATGLVLTGIFALYPIKFSSFLAGFAGPALFKLAGLTGSLLFSPIGLMIGAVIAVIASAAKGAIDAESEFKKKREDGESIFSALMSALRALFIGAIFAIPDGVINLASKVVGLFDKEAAEAMKDFSLTEIVNDFFKNVYETLATAFKGIVKFFTKFFQGQDTQEIDDEIAQLEEERDNTSKSLVKKRENIQKRIDKLKEKRKEAEAEGGRVGGLLNTDLDLVVSMQQNYKGGLIKKGELSLVGERGPELIVPLSDAQAFSARRTEDMMIAALNKTEGGGDGGTVLTQVDNRVTNQSSVLSVNNTRITNPNSTLNAIVNQV